MVFRDLSRDILGSQDLKIVRDVFERVSSEPWFTAHAEKRDEFARYVVRMYRKGVVIPDKLEAVCPRKHGNGRDRPAAEIPSIPQRSIDNDVSTFGR